MAKPMSPNTLRRVLEEEGLEVVGYRNWKYHDRGNRGAGWGPINGILMHHTVTSGTESSVSLCYYGHASLPGPLCQGVIDKDGTVYLVSAGRANHAGNGDDDVLRAVIAERDAPVDNEANTDGNARFYGFECINLGNGRDPWPDVQVDAMVRAAAAIARHYNWNEESVIAHKEWQPGKIDPRGDAFDNMDDFRGRVATRLEGPASAGSTSGDDEDMPGYVSLGRWSDVVLDPGKEDAVEFTHEYVDDYNDHYMPGGSQFVKGKARFSGEANFELVAEDGGPLDLLPGIIQVRLSEVNGDHDYVANSGRAEFDGSEGTTFVKFNFTDYVGKGRGVRLRIKHFNSTPVRIKSVTLKALVWK